jgi:hypothetical protein
MGFLDDLANVLTGGAYGLTQAAIQGIAGAVGSAAGGSHPAPSGGGGGGACSGASGPPTPSPAAGAAPACCCRYSIEGDYVLDCRTGDVWAVDKAKRQMIPIPRHWSKVDSAAGALHYALIEEQLAQKREALFADLHHSVRPGLERKFDAMLKVLEAHVQQLQKAAGEP